MSLGSRAKSSMSTHCLYSPQLIISILCGFTPDPSRKVVAGGFQRNHLSERLGVRAEGRPCGWVELITSLHLLIGVVDCSYR